MTEDRFLVTGSAGCIGAWVLRNLVREGVPVTAFDRDGQGHRLALLLGEDEIARIQFIQGDITDVQAVANALKESRANR